MPATRPETPGRPTRTLLALALVGAAACAANSRQDASPVSVQATLDEAPAAPAGAVAEAPAEPIEELEASLAAYEQQLAYNESRLRAMGVRIAAVTDTEAEAGDDRFAPPPPAPGGDAPYDKRRDSSKAKKAEQRPSSPDADMAAGPTSPSSPRPRPQSATRTPTAKPTQPTRGAGSGYVESKPAAAKNADGEVDRCGELCELADATCDLEVKICDLATRHTSEPRYAEVCRRAGDDCRLAADACTRCSP